MKALPKILLIIIFIFLIYISTNLLLTNTSANDFLGSFLPSEENYQNLNKNSAELIGPTAEKSFQEFSEETIDPLGFYLRIDKINFFKKIIKDVDPRYEEIYRKSWEYGVSHGKFTSTPEKIGITYLFAHAVSNKSTALDSNAWFSYLDQLAIGDEIIVYFQGKKYFYEVSEIFPVSPTATGFYTGASSIAKVRLQYCGPPTGSLKSRTLVDAVQTKVINI